MAFIPNPKTLRVGDRIRINKAIEVCAGTYTVGHEFVIIGSGERGFDLRDDDGNTVRETIRIQDTFEKIS